MPTEGVVQYAGVLDCMRMGMPAIEGLATLSWTLFYKGFVPRAQPAKPKSIHTRFLLFIPFSHFSQGTY